MKGLLFGTYDPLHYGHIRLFRECKKSCDFLVVCLHDDDYIRTLKHREPFSPLEDRLKDLEDISTIDEILINHIRPRDEWVAELKPDVVFLSEELSDRGNIPPHIIVKFMPRTKGVSSTDIRSGTI